MLEKEFEYYLKNKDEILAKYNNKYIVIIGEQVIEQYETQEEALKDTVAKHKIGSFLIQKVSKNEDDTTARFFSKVYV